jgi:acyl dehydratase
MATAMNPMRARIEELQASCPLDLGVTNWTAISKREADAFDRLAGAAVDFAIHPGGPRRTAPVNPLHLLALLSGFAAELGVPGIESTEHVTMLNYGYDDVRWYDAADPGVRIRDRIALVSVTEKSPGQFLMVQRHELEVEGGRRPVMTALSPGLAVLL